MKKTALFALLILFVAGVINSGFTRTIRVPLDEPNIEDGLDAAGRGDTVLVADGVYTDDENVDLDIGTQVVLISENGPESCIIDGDGDARHAFSLDNRSVLYGFTIIRTREDPVTISRGESNWKISHCIFNNISNENDSVGIYLNDCEGLVEFCSFSDLRGNGSGSAFFITNGEIEFNYCYFENCTSDGMGGAIYIRGGAEVEFTNCVFERNEARFRHGGAIAMFGRNTEVIINFCNFTDNEAQNWGGAIYKDENSRPIIANSIFWGNEAGFGNQLAADWDENGIDIRIFNCIVEGGDADQEHGWFGDDLVEEEPLYARGRDPIWGTNGFYLDEESPGIDQGSDSAEELNMDQTTTQTSLEPDAGIVDIGYHYDLSLYYSLGQLFGYVYDIETGDPIAGATVISSLDQRAQTNGNGRWLIPEAFADTIHTLSAIKHGFNDSTEIEVELVEGEQIETNFSLYHPTFSIDPQFIRANTELGDTGSVDLTISNDGNGSLIWSSSVELVGMDRDPWTVTESFLVGQAVADDRIAGVAYIDGIYYVTGAAGNDTNVIYKFDAEGEYLDSFPQFGHSNYGMAGLTYDGELLWGAEDDSVFGFTTDGELVTKWPMLQVRGEAKYIAWDSDRELLWHGDRTHDIYGADRDGNPGPYDVIDRNGLTVYGLSYWSEDPDGFPLYILTRVPNDNNGYIYKADPETGEMMLAATVTLPVGRPATGFITQEIDPFSVYFLTIGEAGRNDGGDRISKVFMNGNSAWMMLDNTDGIVDPGNEMMLNMRLFSDRFDYGQFDGRLTISHNSVGSPFEIDITLNILDVPYNDEAVIPRTSSLQSVHPNPFNSRVTVNFLVSDYSPITLTVFDITGRVVQTESQLKYGVGLNQHSFDASNWGAGVYFVQLSTLTHTHAMKIICLK